MREKVVYFPLQRRDGCSQEMEKIFRKRKVINTVYHRLSCTSSKKTISWLKKYGIPVEVVRIENITKEALIQLLSLTDGGINDIIKNKTRSNSVVLHKVKHLESLSFNEALEYLLQNPILLKSPLLIGDNKYMIGFHSENIREFMPKAYRRH